jgi:putative ABC transport system permease protein
VLVNALVALAPENLPRVGEIRIDTTVLMFSLGLSIAATLLFGLLPALHASRLNLSDTLKLGGGKTTAGAGARLRSSLVVLEIALSVMLLAGAGLLLRSFQMLNHVALGFNSENVVVAQTQAVPAPGPDGRRLRALFYRDFVARLRTTPGVEAAAGVSVLPLGRETVQGAEYFIEGRPEGLPGERPRTETKSISSGFFDTLRIPLRAGRDFNDGDTLDRPRVVIVSESLARATFPDESPIGRRIKLGTGGPWLDIVGVVGDTRWIDPSLRPAAQVYTPSLQGGGSLTILVRGAGGAPVLGSTIRQLMLEMNKNVPIRLDTMDELFSNSVAHARFRTRLIGMFGAMALLLAAVGIFSVLAYLVGQRTRELAVRRAVGASAGDVIRLIVGRGAKLIAIGLALGLAGALAVSRALEGVLYEISPWDVASYLGAVVVLGVVAMLATLLPAARAATIDPVIALRQE